MIIMIPMNYNIEYSEFIYHQRILQNITQETLCSGICSITYLSKIENKKIKPTQEVLELLLNRLNIQLENLADMNDDYYEHLLKWYYAILEKDFESCAIHYNFCENNHEKVSAIKLIYLKELIYFRELIEKRKIALLLEKFSVLKKYESKFDDYLNTYYIYFISLYEAIIQNDYEKALHKLLGISTFFDGNSADAPEYYYHLAMIYTYLNKSTQALQYTKKSLEIYHTQLAIKKIFECRLLLAINYNRLHQYQEAITNYEIIINHKIINKYKMILYKAFNNLGVIYKNIGEYVKAEDYFKKALDIMPLDSPSYQNSICELAELYYLQKKVDAALKIIKKYVKKETYTPTQAVLKIIELNINGKTEELIAYIEEVALPIFEKNPDNFQLQKYYQYLGDLYFSQYHYKNSAIYYKKVINLINLI